jgi:hypothetical protein
VFEPPRLATRRSVAISGKLSVHGAHHPVVVRNLSTEGALIVGATSLTPGDRVRLRFMLLAISSEVEVHATVRWVRAQGTGVEFDPLPPRQHDVLTQFLDRHRTPIVRID